MQEQRPPLDTVTMRQVRRGRLCPLQLVLEAHDVTREQYIGTLTQLPKVRIGRILPDRTEITKPVFVGDIRKMLALLNDVIGRHPAAFLGQRLAAGGRQYTK